MRYLSILSVLLTLLLLGSCGSSSSYIGSASDGSEDSINNVDLTNRLKGYAGIRVYGNGPSAKIFARGVNSISNNTPLFILNGNQVGDYPDLYSMVNTREIKRIEVLVKPDEIGIYGFRGANGVIKVTTVEDREKE